MLAVSILPVKLSSLSLQPRVSSKMSLALLCVTVGLLGSRLWAWVGVEGAVGPLVRVPVRCHGQRIVLDFSYGWF